MTAVLAAGIALFHIFIFIACVAIFVLFYKKDKYSKIEISIFTLTIALVGVIGFFIANHFALLSTDKSVLLAMGYTAIPITQMGMVLLSYPIITLLKERFNLRYPPIILGIIASAPFSYLLTTILSPTYWSYLGEKIYG